MDDLGLYDSFPTRGESPRRRSITTMPGAAPTAPTAFAETSVTLAAWLILILSAMGVVCALAMMPLERKFFSSSGSVHCLLQRDPSMQDMARERCAALCWLGLCAFSLTALGAGGMIQRKPRGLWVMRVMAIFWIGVFLLPSAAWLSHYAGARSEEFTMGSRVGVGCVIVFAVLVGALRLSFCSQIKLQFRRRMLLPQQTLIPALVTLGAADLQNALQAGPQPYPQAGASATRRPRQTSASLHNYA